MEKLKAHYSLSIMQQLIREGKYRITASARKTAIEEMNLSESEVTESILDLIPSDLYKSMTTLHNSKLWQDVYHKKLGNKNAYIKLQLLDDNTIIISFKEK